VAGMRRTECAPAGRDFRPRLTTRGRRDPAGRIRFCWRSPSLQRNPPRGRAGPTGETGRRRRASHSSPLTRNLVSGVFCRAMARCARRAAPTSNALSAPNRPPLDHAERKPEPPAAALACAAGAAVDSVALHRAWSRDWPAGALRRWSNSRA